MAPIFPSSDAFARAVTHHQTWFATLVRWLRPTASGLRSEPKPRYLFSLEYREMAWHFVGAPTPETTVSVAFASMIVLIASLLAFPQATHPQTVYKWVDDEGTVHYDENPPVNNTPHESLDIAVDQIEPKYEPPPAFKYTPSNKKPKRSKQKNRSSSQQRIAQRCEHYSKKFAHYTSRLRAGYKPKQYNHLTEKRRYYRQMLRDHCRKIQK